MLDCAGEKQKVLGQFFTPDLTVEKCIKIMDFKKNIIEPSYGNGAFLKQLSNKTIGIEVDEELFKKYNKENCFNMNFYDFNNKIKETTFIGNPPYRVPAYSLTTHNSYIKSLMNKYNIIGVKEEAIFFLLKTVDLLLENKVNGNIGYILPKSLFTNDSKPYKSFHLFFQRNLNLLKVIDVDQDFDNVDQDLVFIYCELGRQKKETFLYNNIKTNYNHFFGKSENVIKMSEIFKKTYLGSVPAESIFLSCKKESKIEFKDRLVKLFNSNVTKKNMISYLSYNGQPHLKALKNKNENKINTVFSYIQEVKNNFDISKFLDLYNYKPIQHRTEKRFYFRNKELKRFSFVYILNPNPCESFYYPGNPTKSSTDYFGYCEYDVNRNSSPGANRTIPLSNIKENIHESFLKYWKTNTDKPIENIYDYLLFVSKSNWYKNFKNKYQRFYFSIPLKFLNDW